MSNYDFQQDLQNDAAKKNYDAAMSGQSRKGVEYFEKPHLWDEERPCDMVADSPTENFVPMPTVNTGDGFSTYSIVKKIAIIAGIVIAVAVVGFCTVTFFMDGGGKIQGLGDYPFW